jgi:hypothetical protein
MAPPFMKDFRSRSASFGSKQESSRHATTSVWTLLALILVSPISAQSQGRVYFSNFTAANLVTNGLTGRPVPVGTTFKVALYFAPDGVIDEAEFIQLGASVGFGPEPGYFNGGSLEVPGVTGGDYAMFQVRAWESAFGATYEEAVSNPNPQGGRLALAGQTGIMRVQPGFGTQPAAPLVGGNVEAVVGAPLRDGFILTVVPEPTPTLLCLMGMAGLAVYAWRRLS